ncbi:MAG: hypothetical protein WAU57_09805, partial [Xanthobacteraceae bacterium]
RMNDAGRFAVGDIGKYQKDYRSLDAIYWGQCAPREESVVESCARDGDKEPASEHRLQVKMYRDKARDQEIPLP